MGLGEGMVNDEMEEEVALEAAVVVEVVRDIQYVFLGW